jgi:hypothetical protein
MFVGVTFVQLAYLWEYYGMSHCMLHMRKDVAEVFYFPLSCAIFAL